MGEDPVNGRDPTGLQPLANPFEGHVTPLPDIWVTAEAWEFAEPGEVPVSWWVTSSGRGRGGLARQINLAFGGNNADFYDYINRRNERDRCLYAATSAVVTVGFDIAGTVTGWFLAKQGTHALIRTIGATDAVAIRRARPLFSNFMSDATVALGQDIAVSTGIAVGNASVGLGGNALEVVAGFLPWIGSGIAVNSAVRACG